jgi:hypothetical protein
MKQIRRLMVVAAVAAVACGASRLASAAAREQRTLQQLLTLARDGRRYVPATPADLRRCEDLFVRTLRDAREPELESDWEQMGFRLMELRSAEAETWLIIEPPHRKRGWGFYVLCPGNAPGLVLQAPHSFADRHTGDVALRLFADGGCAAVAWNTVPRHRVDVAHCRQHPFSAFTLAVARVHPDSCIVQVHGFSPDKRSTTAGAAADLIVSNGTHLPDQALHQFVGRLQSEFDYGRVQLFPADVRELGATQNVQGELLRELGTTRFVHLEMSQDLRLRLIVDPDARQAILKNLNGCVD